mmetsp:Transcript_32945/g.54429  ORF Transcript_32945/g.54429 Transcript_32945/m.54429 type:complete len:224 (-) Transcript_32945:318-989(-)
MIPSFFVWLSSANFSLASNTIPSSSHSTFPHSVSLPLSSWLTSTVFNLSSIIDTAAARRLSGRNSASSISSTPASSGHGWTSGPGSSSAGSVTHIHASLALRLMNFISSFLSKTHGAPTVGSSMRSTRTTPPLRSTSSALLFRFGRSRTAHRSCSTTHHSSTNCCALPGAIAVGRLIASCSASIQASSHLSPSGGGLSRSQSSFSRMCQCIFPLPCLTWCSPR